MSKLVLFLVDSVAWLDFGDTYILSRITYTQQWFFFQKNLQQSQ